MTGQLVLSEQSRTTAGVLLLSIVAIAWGGTFLLKVVRGREEVTAFQASFFRAGHAHAGVLVTLALVCQVLADAVAPVDGGGDAVAALTDWVGRHGVAFAAILMPAGFFLSATGRGRQHPNRLVVLVWAGAFSLAAGVLSLGVRLLTVG